MKTKAKKFATPREKVRLLIQPRRRRSDDEDAGEENTSSISSDTPSTPSTAESVPSNSSIAEIPCVIRKESKDHTDSDGFRALLKVNDNCYEVDISDEKPSPIINDYPDGESDSKDDTKGSNVSKSSTLRRKKRFAPSICLMGTRYSVVSRVAKSLGWKIVRDMDLWNIYWTDSVQGVDMYKDMKRFQKVNHFPGMVEICRKDLLARNLIRMQRLFPSDYNFFPRTWCFPADLGDAISYSRQYKNKTFILKPDTGAQGRGIWITKNLKEIKPNERMICQVYVNKPLLIDGYKFDLRVYTLVTSVDPLRVFVYNEGLARFATSKYKEPSGHNTSNVYMHLTNYSVNKHSRTFCKDDEIGSKRKFSTLNRILSSEGYDVDKLWSNIDEIIVKTILSAWPVLKHNYHACFPCHDIVQACFEILGFDVLVDGKMKPILLEVNHSPSFHTDEVIDKEIKEALIRDTFKMLNITNVDKKKILKEDKRRVQSRLLQKIRDSCKATSMAESEPINFDGIPRKVQLSPHTQQIAWEESNLGNFRRVMPAPDNPNKYTAFLILQNQASIYSDTAASKRREEAAKQLRSEITQKALKDTKLQLMNSKKHVVENIVESVVEPKQKKPVPPLKKKIPILRNHINEYEERERTGLLTQRDFLIRSSGLVQIIFESFYHNDLLSESDKKKFQEIFDKLEEKNREKCLAHTEQAEDEDSGDVLSNYISTMPIPNPTKMLERLKRVRGKYSELYRKPMMMDNRDRFIS